MLSQKPIRVLAENQKDCDIIWADVFAEKERYNTKLSKTLSVGNAEFRFMAIPYSYYTISPVADFIVEAEKTGFPIVFVGGRPSALADKPELPLPEAVNRVPVVSLEELPAFAASFADVKTDVKFPDLRVFHYSHEADLYMISNESTSETFSGKLTLEGEGEPVLYDAMENCLIAPEIVDGALQLTLEPYQAVIVAFGHSEKGNSKSEKKTEKLQITGPWNVSLKAAMKQEEGYKPFTQLQKLESLATLAPTFSGWVRYESEFNAADADISELEIEKVYECAEVFINGESAGTVICPPYRFDISGMVKPGKNTLTIEVATTLERVVEVILADPANQTGGRRGRKSSWKNPFGLIGSVAVK